MREQKVGLIRIITFLIVISIGMAGNGLLVRGEVIDTEILTEQMDVQQVEQENVHMIGEEQNEAEQSAECIVESTESETELSQETIEVVEITELDLGDYQTQMVVGDMQLLTVTPIPHTGAEHIYTFSSANEEVATINGLGRITAQKAGTTVITVASENISESFTLMVEEQEKEEIIPVNDIEIADYEAELEVGNTLMISATVLPANASEYTLSFRTSDNNIATVTSTGEVKGLSKGNVTIYCSAGSVTKEIPISVKVRTTGIEMNSTYIVLKPGEKFLLEATVMPAEAEQVVTYRSTKPEIATITETGTIEAKKCGSTSIIVSNGDTSIAVSVIVNERGEEACYEESDKKIDSKSIVYPTQISAGDTVVITEDMLKFFYETQDILTVKGSGYVLKVDGSKIKNYSNELLIDIQLMKEEEGISFVLNKGNELCGEIILELEDVQEGHLYLYNESKQQYEQLETDNLSELRLTTAGKYLIADEADIMGIWNMHAIIGAGIVVIIMVGVYIGIKKKYWFW